MPNFISEDQIEQAMVQRLQHLCGYDAMNCYTADPDDTNDGSGRTDKREVILRDRLKEAAIALNPGFPESAIDDAIKQLCDKRQVLAPIAANREVDSLIRDGVLVEFRDEQGRNRKERVKVIDFSNPASPHNEFVAVTQLWIQSTGATAKAGYRRPDILLYVNGLPLVFIELKNSNVKLRTAYEDNLTSYKFDIPQLFLANALCVLSNGIETRVGSMSAEWEHFFPWLRPDDEKEKVNREKIREEGTSAERFLAGICPKAKLLDYVENFILYHKDTQKIIAQNHQFLGVNRAFGVFVERRSVLDKRKCMVDTAKETLTPSPSPSGRGEEEMGVQVPHYRGGYDFSGLVKRARELRERQTPAEDILWRVLRNRQFLGLKFRRQHEIGDYIVDFYCDAYKLIIEADGEIHETETKHEHDTKRDAILTGQGFQVIRIKNQTVLENPQVALEQIALLCNPLSAGVRCVNAAESLPSPAANDGSENPTANGASLPSPAGRGAGGEGNTPPANGLGVFWHTQGSGKSFSMIFYARKIFRKCAGNYSFVVVTDREDLDGQIYRNFLNTGTVRKADAAQPKDSAEMRKFLGQNKRLVFTLIHKFRWPKGQKYPLLSDRDDIIVIVDEAHRTQYKSLAENMRAGLPKAQYLAFTGTPLLGRERKTNAWFGDYVSEYNFQQSADDGATVPLHYSKRVPEVLIQNEDLSEEFYEILEDEHLDDARQAKLENRFATELEVIKRDDRLETIAADVVAHFPHRGYLGKGLFVAVDKFTAVEMHNRVKRLWKAEIKSLRGQVKKATTDIKKARLQRTIDWMKAVEMAVVVSEEAGEEKKFDERGLDIRPHRKRMTTLDKHGHDIEYKFKDPADPLQLVFVCAMWLTGFDAPTLSTMYLDKPQRDHTLMQTIARANRVTSWKIRDVEKKYGDIVDYYNVFRSMKKALKDYATGAEGADEPPVQDKSKLFPLLDDAVEQGIDWCRDIGIKLAEVLETKDVFRNVERLHEFADTLLLRDEWRKTFNVYENSITGLYEACKPEVLGRPVVRAVALFQYLRGVVDAIIEQQDVDEACRRVTELLDESVIVDADEPMKARETTTSQPEFRIVQRGKTWDLSRIDFDELKKDFKEAVYKNIEIADLRSFIAHKLEQMLQQNRSRRDFAERLQEIIDRYNAGSTSSDRFYNELVQYTKALKQEAERHVREGLTEDELEIYDLLAKEKMTEAETRQVRLAAKSLLHRLKEEIPPVLVQDWYRDSQTQQVVRSAIGEVLDEHLPQTYERGLFTEKRDSVFDLVLDLASHGRKWAA